MAERAALLDRLDAGHAAARRAQGLDGDQAEQAEPDDDDAIAERRLCAAHALERDRPDRGEGRVAHRDRLGDGDDEVRGHGDDVGVVCTPRSGAGDPLADVQLGAAAGVEDGPGAGVAERRILGDGAADRVDRLPDAVLAGVPKRLRDEVRVLDRARCE